jgi:hypothetical protein
MSESNIIALLEILSSEPAKTLRRNDWNALEEYLSDAHLALLKKIPHRILMKALCDMTIEEYEEEGLQLLSYLETNNLCPIFQQDAADADSGKEDEALKAQKQSVIETITSRFAWFCKANPTISAKMIRGEIDTDTFRNTIAIRKYVSVQRHKQT